MVPKAGTLNPKTNLGKRNHQRPQKTKATNEKKTLHEPEEPAWKRPNKKLKTHSGGLIEEVVPNGDPEDDIALHNGSRSVSDHKVRDAKNPDAKLLSELKGMVSSIRSTGGIRHDTEQISEDIRLHGQDEGRDPLGKRNRKGANSLRGSSSRLLLAPRQDWFNIKLPEIPSNAPQRPREKVVSQLLSHGVELLKQDNQLYTDKKNSSSQKFYSTIISSGTLSDKISALTLSVQESPLHNMQALEGLMGLAKKRSRSQAVQVLGAIKDLFSSGSVLPSDRRLLAFAAQPALAAFPEESLERQVFPGSLPSPLQKVHLVIWAFEDWLKTKYFEFIKLLEVWCFDEIVFSRLKAVDYVYELLREKPEQEANLLHLLVNKLGDPDKNVASRASSNIIRLQAPHPFMKQVVVSAIESDVLFKQGQTLHAKYYAVITLNQTVLNGGLQDLVEKLLETYFSLFLLLLDKHQPMQYQGGLTSHKKKQKTPNALAKGEASRKPAKVSGTSQTSEDELREKIMSAVLTGINRAVPFASSNHEFFEKHLDTLFRITHSSNFNTSLQALMLILQLCDLGTVVSDRFYRTLYESLLDPRLNTTSKQTQYINLVFRALKADLNMKRVQSFIKRIAQVTATHQPAFACSALYLIKELKEYFPTLSTLTNHPETVQYDGDSVDREAFQRANEEPGDHAMAIQAGSKIYDGRKRDPQFSNADQTCLWELDPLLCHFHPSVALFASELLSPSENTTAKMTKPELSMHTLIGFLDRFIYRNPKKASSGLRGPSMMQPLTAAAGADLLFVPGASRLRTTLAPINSAQSSSKKGGKINPDEVFFHRYFDAKARGDEGSKKRQDKLARANTGPAGEIVDDEGEEEVWKALVDSRPELEADTGSTFDMESDISDLQSTFWDSSEEDEFQSEGTPWEQPGDSDSVELDEDFGEAWDSDVGTASQVAGGTSPVVTQVESSEQKSNMKRKRRKMLQSLPTFASADEFYADVMQRMDMPAESLA